MRNPLPFLLVSALLVHSGGASDLYWLGTTDGNFSGENWTNVVGGAVVSGLMPLSGDTLYFDTEQTNFVDVAGSFAINNDLPLSDLQVRIFDNRSTGDFVLAGLDTSIGAGGISSEVLQGVGSVIGWASPGIGMLSPGAFLVNAGGLSVTSPVDNGGNLLTVDGVGSVSLGGAISGSGGLVKRGNGVMSLGGTNSFSGQLAVESGTMSIATINNAGVSGRLGQSGLGVILGAAGGQVGTLQFTGGAASSTKSFTMASGGTGGFQVSNGGTTLTLSGLIGGGGGLIKSGAGSLALTNGSNSYSGGTEISGGSLVVTSDGQLGAVPSVASGSNIRISNGGTLVLSDASNNVSLAANRGITLGEGVQKLVKYTRKTATINGVISGVGGLNFGDSTVSGGDGGGGGRYQINAANTYSGETTISYLGVKDPGVVLNHSLALQNTTLNYNNANATGADLLWFNGGNSSYTLGGLKGDKTLNLSPQGNTAHLLKIGNNGQSTTFSGVIRSSTDAAAGIMKVGSGTLTLSGANTYTGTTTVGQGTLSVSSVVASGSSNLGNATSAVVLGDSTHQGTLAYTGGSVTFTRGLNVAAGGGRLEVSSGRTLTLGTGVITGTNALLTIGGGGNTTLVARVNLGLVGGGLVKEGAGILNINSGVSDGLQNYRTLTTMAGAGMTNVNSPLGTGLSDGTGTDVVAGGNLRFGNVSQTLNSLSIGEGATVTFTSELAVGSLGGSGEEKAVGLGSAVVPEASSVGLLMLGSLGILGRRRLSGRAK